MLPARHTVRDLWRFRVGDYRISPQMLVLSSWCSPSRIGDKSTGSAGRIVTASTRLRGSFPPPSFRHQAAERLRVGDYRIIVRLEHARLITAAPVQVGQSRRSPRPGRATWRPATAARHSGSPTPGRRFVVLPSGLRRRTCPAPAAVGGSSPRISVSGRYSSRAECRQRHAPRGPCGAHPRPPAPTRHGMTHRTAIDCWCGS